MVVFFFQAEDGIRDLVRSRGLGDVYKRQTLYYMPLPGQDLSQAVVIAPVAEKLVVFQGNPGPVSYTHLTLPTSDLV